MDNISNFATVAAVDPGKAVRLTFDGESSPSAKWYRYNKDADLAVGDRVKIFRDSGTIVVEYALTGGI